MLFPGSPRKAPDVLAMVDRFRPTILYHAPTGYASMLAVEDFTELKVRGIWVSPIEVESVLVSHPAVLECIVVGHPDRANLIKPKAFVVLKPGRNATEALAEELIAQCRERAADFKRPRWVEFVDDLPRTATGKIQRFRMRESRDAVQERDR